MLNLSKWVSEKAISFNRGLVALSETRKAILNISGRLLRGITDFLQAARLEGCPEYRMANALLEAAETASMQTQEKETLWNVNKQELV